MVATAVLEQLSIVQPWVLSRSTAFSGDGHGGHCS